MNTSQSTLSSPRNQRILFWIGLLALTAGVVVLIVKLVGGSDPTPVSPSQGFKPTLPAKTSPLTTANGGKITTYYDLPPQIKQSITGFIVPGVMNDDYGASWKYTAPNITQGATLTQWANASARSLIPLPGYTYKGAQFKLVEASSKEILVQLKLHPGTPAAGHDIRMKIGLIPAGTGANKHWLVNYWMPDYGPPVPYDGNG